MSKTKKLLITLMLLIAVLLLPNMVSASNEEPTVSTEVYGSNKSIKVILEDISLEDSVNEYKFGISKAKATQPTEWLDLQEIETSTCTAIITPENEIHRNILRSGNKCYLFVKDITNDTVKIVTQVDLSLPLDSALNIIPNTREGFEISYLYRNGNDLGNYNITSIKIDDVEVIKKYLEAKNNNQNTLNAVKNMLSTEIPNNTWKRMEQFITDEYAWINYSGLTEYEGLYMIWGQVSYSEGRSIYGYILYDNYPNDYVLPEENEPTTPPTTDEPTIDTTTYVSFPFIIYNGKGSIDLKSGVDIENYKMYYQFVEVSDEVYNKITELQDKYKNGEITYEEYFVQYNSVVTKYNNKNWVETKDGNFNLDLSKFTGTKKFALWVKLETEDKTVYESQIYKMNGSGTATNEPDATQKPSTTDKETTKDTTTAKDKLPNTGRVLLFWIIGIVAVSGIVAHIRYKKLYM